LRVLCFDQLINLPLQLGSKIFLRECHPVLDVVYDPTCVYVRWMAVGPRHDM
jgi:hypothetical protein